MAINETTLDVHLQPVNQQAPNTTAPIGRLAKMTNAVAEQFEGSFLRTVQRTGFRQLTKKVKNPTSNVVETTTAGFSDTPTLMSSLETELVVVADNSPYVLAENAAEWSHYPYVLHTNATRQRPVYTSNVKIKTEDSACIENVVCYTWRQTSPEGVTTAWVMVKDVDGTVITTPTSIAQATDADAQTVQIKVCQDGVRFWVFYSATTSMLVNTIEKDGTFSGFSSFATLADIGGQGPSFWDIQHNECGVVWYGQTGTVIHAIYSFVWSSGTITPTLYDKTADFGSAFPPDRPFWFVDPHDVGNVYPGWITNGEPAQIFVAKMSSTYVTDYVTFLQVGFVFNNVCEVTGCIDEDLNVHVFRSDVGTAPVFNLTAHTVMDIALATTDTVIHSVTAASRPFELNGRPSLLMFFDDGVQPTFFLHDVITDQVCGMWAHGSSDQTWQGTQNADQHKNYDSCHVPSPYVDLDGNAHCATAFLAESFSKNFVTFTRTGSDPITSINTAKFVSTVGLSDVEFSYDGRATEYADELLIPGPSATCFTGAVFTEDNFHLFPSPFSVAQSHSDAGNLEIGKPYSLVVVFEYTDTRGNRVKSRPSDPLLVTLTSTNNIMTITGPTLFETYGKSNVMISIYSTYIIGGNISTEHRKITDDLNPLLNDKSSLTWSFIFNLTNETIEVGEILYTDNGLLAHDPCPAHSSGCIAGNRFVIAGWDGKLWFSNEKQDDEPLTFSVGYLQVSMPTSDPIRALECLDSMRVIVFCERSVWEWDISNLPGPDGLNGSITSPKRLPFNNGCVGQSHLMKDGAAYVSSVGGVWMVTRGLENIQLSSPEYQDFKGQTIAGIATDDKQRTMFGLLKEESFQSIIRDGINFAWSDYTHPRKIVKVHSLRGQFVYADDISVHLNDETPYDTFLYDGTQAVTNVAIVQDIKTAPINFGTVKGLKCVWRFIVNGQSVGQYAFLVDATFETEDGTYTQSWSVPWSTLTQEFPLLEISFEPDVIEMSSIALRLRPDYTGVTSPGKSFELETISFEAGIDSYLNRTPAKFRG